MMLTVDIGNTNISVALFGEEDEPLFVKSYPDNSFHTADEFYRVISSYDEKPTSAVLCSVVPVLTGIAKEALEKLTDGNVLVIDSDFRDTLPIASYDRNKLGNDRIADMTAAKELYGTPAVVIDMGTASTVSVIDREGVFIGGMILPGIALSINALSSGTALLPGVKPYVPNSLLGQDTVSCINNGVLCSQASSVEGIVSRVEELLGEKVSTVITGGSAKLILPLLRKKSIYDANLLHKGLKILYKNKEKS